MDPGHPSKLGQCIDRQAQATRGTLEGDLLGTPVDVLVIASEDAGSTTIAPRLLAAGADMDRVHRVDITEDGFESVISLPLDIARLHDTISEVHARFVILDALDDVLDGKLDSHKSASIRQALSPINQVANEAKCAILGVTHLNKSSGTDFIYRILGSTAYTAAARSVIGVFPDPTDETGETKLVRVGKANLGVIPREAEVIRIVSTPVVTDTDVFDIGRVEVIGTREVDVDELLTTVDENDIEDISDAGRWLLKLLANQGGEATRQDIIEAGRKAGYSKDQLVRARKRAGVTTKRHGSFGAPTSWYHPANPPQGWQPE